MKKIDRCCIGDESRIDFVTHSLGGILLRAYAKNMGAGHIGRAVLLSPPSRGLELVDELKDVTLFQWITGPAGQRLGTDPDSVPLKLGPANFEVGVITGDVTFNPLYSWLIPGPDDGTVSVDRAKLDGMTDFIVLPQSHSFIMNREEVIRQKLYFLSHGRFDHKVNPDDSHSRKGCMLRSTDTRYGVITRLLHWIVALIIIGLILLGWWMVDLSYYDRWYNRSLELHKSLGMAALVIAALKIAWVIYDGKPDFQASIKPWERAAATAAHHLLYLLMLLIPATGYVISTSAGDAIPVFGLFEVPALLSVSDTLRDLAVELHFWMAYGTGVLILVHALAAFKHQLIDRDGTLERIL